MLEWACIAPHGGEIIAELADGNLAKMARTRAGMEELERRAREAAPELLVVLTPHGLYVPDNMCVSITPQAAGQLEGEHGASIYAAFEVDQSFAEEIALRAGEVGVPVVMAAVDEEGKPVPLLPLDWGALIPLWYLGANWEKPPRVVIICPSRELTRRQLIDFGKAIAIAASERAERVGLVCSADQGHGHAADGPYGFAENSAPYDAAYCDAVAANELARLLTWDDDWIESALPDSYWQTLVLHGALQHTPLQGELLSYEAPTYFGMAVAEYGKGRGERIEDRG